MKSKAQSLEDELMLPNPRTQAAPRAPATPRAPASPRAQASDVELDPRWAKLLARQVDGSFFYAVKTTGVYCRPSCGARPPKPENIEFHATAAAAERAGFRPCKRCKPEQPPLAERNAAQVAELCRLIEQSEVAPSLEQLARHAGLSPFYTHRLFKAVTGVTPRGYAAARRAERIRRGLPKSTTVTAAIYEAGYNSGARFYEKSDALLGMTPSQYRAGAPALRIRFALEACSLGKVLVAASERGICAILLGDDPSKLVADLEHRFARAELVAGDAELASLVQRVVGMLEQPRLGASLPLDIRGTAFQQRVWQQLCKIPAGSTRTYGDIARALGAPSAVRAVARACAANPLAVAVPCHRVLSKGGESNGYRWGLERKRALLEREAEP